MTPSPTSSKRRASFEKLCLDHHRNDPEALTRSQLIDVLIRVTETIAAASERGFVPEKLCPETIVVAEHGEIELVHWTSLSEQSPPREDKGPVNPDTKGLNPKAIVDSLGGLLLLILQDPASKSNDPDFSMAHPNISPELNWIAAQAKSSTGELALFARRLRQYRGQERIEGYPYSLSDKVQLALYESPTLLPLSVLSLLAVVVLLSSLRSNEKVLQLKSLEVEALQVRLRVLEAKAQLEKQAREIEPSKDTEFLFLEAKVAIRQGESRSAIIEKIDRALNSSQKSGADYLQAAQLYHRAGMISLSRAALQKALALKGHEQEALWRLHLLELSERALLRGQFEMTRSFEKLIELNKNNPDSEFIHFSKGWKRLTAKKYSDALRSFELAAQNHQFMTHTKLYRAKCFKALGQFDKALKDLNHCLRDDEDNVAAWSARAELYGLQKREQLALNDYQRAIALQPRSAELYKARGLLLRTLGRRKECLEDLKKYLELQPQSKDAAELQQWIESKKN